MPTTWEELVTNVTERHPVHEAKMFGMPCLKRQNGKVVAGLWKDGGVNVKLVDMSQREAALAIPASVPAKPAPALPGRLRRAYAGAEPFDPGMGRPLRRRQSRHLRIQVGSVEPTPTREWVLVPASQSDEWERLVEQAIG